MAARFSHGATGPRLKPENGTAERRAAEMAAFLARLRAAGGRFTLRRERDRSAALDCANRGFAQLLPGDGEARLTGLGQRVLDELNRGISRDEKNAIGHRP